MLEISEAKKIILENVGPMDCEMVHITNALDRVLAEDIVADSDAPFRDNSAMDGFAVRAADVAAASPDSPPRLEVIETIPAGAVPQLKVSPGQASRIMTGALIPHGADAVVMVEDTSMSGEHDVLIMKPVGGKNHIRRAGEDVRAGEIVLSAGRILRPADIGMIATCGRIAVRVARRPVVGIFSTGDEIIAPDSPLSPGKVRNSNSFSIYAQCLRLGAVPRLLGIVPDVKSELLPALMKAAAACDLILTTGGVSMGEYDEVRKTIESEGELLFWKVRMKPGKPIVFGRIGGKPIFGLPGNPVSCMVGVELFVRPAILKMMGASETDPQRLRGILEHDLKSGSRDELLRGVARAEPSSYRLTAVSRQGSHILSGMARANCLIHLPGSGSKVRKGEHLEFFFIA